MNVANVTITVLVFLCTSRAFIIQHNNKGFSCGNNAITVLEVIKNWNWPDFILLSDKRRVATCALKMFSGKVSTVIFSSVDNTSAVLGSYSKEHGTKRWVVWVKLDSLESILQAAYRWKYFTKSYSWVFVMNESLATNSYQIFRNFLREDSIVFIYAPVSHLSFSRACLHRVYFYSHPTSHVKTHILTPCDKGGVMAKTTNILYRRHFQNYLMTVGYIPYKPLTYVHQEGNKTNDNIQGFFPELIRTISTNLGFQYQFVHEPSNNFGILHANGSWDGILGLLQRKEVNMTINSATSPLRIPVADFLPTVMELFNKLIIQEPSHVVNNIDFSQFIRPFPMDIWLSLVVILLFSTFCLTLTWSSRLTVFTKDPTFSLQRIGCKRQPYDNKKLPRAAYFFFMLWIVVLKQGLPKRERRKDIPNYLVIASFAVLAVVLTNIYTSILTASLSVKRTSVPYKDLSDLLDSKKYPVGVFHGSLAHQDIINAKTQLTKKLKENVEADPGNIVHSSAVGVQRVCKENFAFIENIQALASQERKCALRIIGKSILSVFVTIAFPKDSPFVEEFGRQLMLIRSSGIWNRLIRIHVKKLDDHSKTVRQSTFGLQQFSGGFLILAIGIIAAFMCLFVEKAAYLTFCIKT